MADNKDNWFTRKANDMASKRKDVEDKKANEVKAENEIRQKQGKSPLKKSLSGDARRIRNMQTRNLLKKATILAGGIALLWWNTNAYKQRHINNLNENDAKEDSIRIEQQNTRDLYKENKVIVTNPKEAAEFNKNHVLTPDEWKEACKKDTIDVKPVIRF